MKFLVFLVLLGVAAALPGLRHRRDSTPDSFQLPANASILLGTVNTGFDCSQLPYGYYADQTNDCAIFHICLPYVLFDEVVTRHFSFICAEGTIFDQERLICDYPESALPCTQAQEFTRVNEYFGQTERNFLE